MTFEQALTILLNRTANLQLGQQVGLQQLAGLTADVASLRVQVGRLADQCGTAFAANQADFTNIESDLAAIAAASKAYFEQIIAAIGGVLPDAAVTGVEIEVGPITSQARVGGSFMAKKTRKTKLLTRGQLKGSLKKATKQDASNIQSIEFLDDGTATCTLIGTDQHGNPMDISGIATLAPPPSSSDIATITVTPLTGMQFQMSAVKGAPLTDPTNPVLVTATATFNDGTTGPFTATLSVTTIADASVPTGVRINVGEITVQEG